MTMSERILLLLKKRNMTQSEFAKQVGIATSTISEWKKKKTKPTADKIIDICHVLQITPEQLLTGKDIDDQNDIAVIESNEPFTPLDIQIINDYHTLKKEQQKRLLAYIDALKNLQHLEDL